MSIKFQAEEKLNLITAQRTNEDPIAALSRLFITQSGADPFRIYKRKLTAVMYRGETQIGFAKRSVTSVLNSAAGEIQSRRQCRANPRARARRKCRVKGFARVTQ